MYSTSTVERTVEGGTSGIVQETDWAIPTRYGNVFYISPVPARARATASPVYLIGLVVESIWAAGQTQ